MAVNHFVRRAVVTIVATVALIPSVFAGKKLGKSDKQWLEQEVAALITQDEGEIFRDLESDGERVIFRRLFWARRDPRPETPANEFQEDFEARLREVNRTFKAPGLPGAATDMGKVVLLLGAPGQSGAGRATEFAPSGNPTETEIEGGSTTEKNLYGGGGGNVQSEASMGGRSTSETLIRTWVYAPNEALGMPDGLTVRFRAQPGFGYRLMSSDALAETLERVRKLQILNPDIAFDYDEDGRLVAGPAGRDVASGFASEVLMELRDTQVLSSDITFSIQPAFFHANEGDTYVPLLYEIDIHSLGLKEDQPNATFVGLVEDAQGNPIFQFEEGATLARRSGRPAVFEMPLQLRPGRYTLYLGVKENSTSKLGTKIETLDVPSFDGETFELSTVLMFSEGVKSEDPFGDVGRAFVIGGYRFTPKLGLVYEKTDRLSGVFNAYGYGTDGDQPSLTAQYIFLQEGVKKGQTKDQPFISATDTAAITVFDMPLSSLEPGDYTLRIRVADHIKNEVLTEDIAFILR